MNPESSSIIKNKKYLIAAAVVLVIIIIAVLTSNRADAPTPTDNTVATSTQQNTATKPKPTTTAPKPSTELIITFNGTSFSPSVLTIKAGQSVRFLNKSNKGMRIVADVATNATGYGEFGQEKTVATNGSYNFTFIRTGTWNYFNQTEAGAKGTVIVK